MTWFTQNLGTIVVLLIVAVISGFATFSIIRNKKKGGCSCGCGCDGCAMAGNCHPDKNKTKSASSTEDESK